MVFMFNIVMVRVNVIFSVIWKNEFLACLSRKEPDILHSKGFTIQCTCTQIYRERKAAGTNTRTNVLSHSNDKFMCAQQQQKQRQHQQPQPKSKPQHCQQMAYKILSKLYRKGGVVVIFIIHLVLYFCAMHLVEDASVIDLSRKVLLVQQNKVWCSHFITARFSFSHFLFLSK